ncbi:unnamed protein product [Protopolystoma xenopodis]|uniref:UTP--glucose-1-phosphate uridylyltransferase n=1 Tax=Protopolystoma xenopodis TaxID=117903 RepID=A0A448WNN2_9PLAT|nr:unnamed protein product [Protopolystoma xenopodis]
MCVRKFDNFNTNNLWLSLVQAKCLLEQQRIRMDLIVNQKTLKDGRRVIQLEEAAGAAIQSFSNPRGVYYRKSTAAKWQDFRN